MERVCTTGDAEAINVIWVKIFEWLIFRPNELRLFWPILGGATRACLKDAAQRWAEAGRSFGHTDDSPLNNIPRP